ncbi:MAG: plastocyanin/azurin family copper-binding protein, partial [Holophagales bacterium]|nr:plastocyanin/azurin family copper-binding protein [Holophagales bacterium]
MIPTPKSPPSLPDRDRAGRDLHRPRRSRVHRSFAGRGAGVPCLVALAFLAAPAQAAEHTVQALPNNTFSPADLTIQVGDTVTWVNGGGFHNVAATDGSFRCAEGCDGQGGNGNPSAAAWSFSLTFDTAGTIDYVCEVHAAIGMTGSVTVEGGPPPEPGDLRWAAASQQRSESAGSFALQVQRVSGSD